MPRVTFRSHHVEVEVPAGASLLDAARQARIRLGSPCNGGGTCGKCKMRIDAEARSHVRVVGSRNLNADELTAGWVLLCSTLIEGDVELDLPATAELGLRILEQGRRADLPLAPWISKVHLADRNVTQVWAGPELLDEEDGDTSARILGVAVDIGSTTLVVSLTNLVTGAALGSISALNPQAVHAQDVLSRITLGSSADGLALLHGEVMGEIDRLIGILASESRIPRRRIYEVVLAGNTCMSHLAAGLNPEPLGRFPYRSNMAGDQYLPASGLGLKIAGCARAYFPPLISGFVGADITAGMLSTDLAGARGVTLFVDIGTNGEMVLARDGLLQATSTAAGPAFEGMNIACGMRAARGAIERVSLEDGCVRLKTIADAPAQGLCGSGLLDAVAELVTHGVVEPSGRFTKKTQELPPYLAERLGERDGKPVFHLTDTVFLSQGDIRQVQLAKGAVRAGIDVLLSRNGLAAEQVDKALIAGSFGYHLTVRSLVDIGLFPAQFAGKVEYVGNTASTGAESLLTNGACRANLAEAVERVEAVELANDEGFTKAFVTAMAFPTRADREKRTL